MIVVRYSRQALRSLMRMPADVRERIVGKITRLAKDPSALAGNVKKLRGRAGYRLRVGKWRVIYEWHRGTPVVLAVLEIGPRGQIYD